MNPIIGKSYHNKAGKLRHMMIKSLLEREKTAYNCSLDLKFVSPFKQAGTYRREKHYYKEVFV